MGLFSSKIPSSMENGIHVWPTKETINESRTVENTGITGQAGETYANEGKSTEGTENTSRKQHCSPKVVRSYSWLISPPVERFETIGKEEKERAKRPEERGNKPKNVMKYNNGKYLKSYQQFANKPVAPQKSNASSLSSSLPKRNKSASSYNRSCGVSKEEKQGTRQTKPTTENRPVVSKPFRVGFGVA